MSLLEILISIFVLLVGLLGVAAVIPAGRVEIVEAIKADRGSACARAALRDARVRGLLNPLSWRYYDEGLKKFVPVVSPNADYPALLPGRRLAPCRTIIIDPLFIAANPGKEAITNDFPYFFSKYLDDHPRKNTSPIRVSVTPVLSSASPLSTARRLFTCRDDLLFPTPQDSEERPRQTEVVDLDPSAGKSVVTTTAWPIRDTDGVSGYNANTPPMPLQSECQSDYTWTATIMPQPGEVILLDTDNNTSTPPVPYYDIDSNPTFHVSIAVCFKRNLACPADWNEVLALERPTERSVRIFFVGGGWGGGDVRWDAYAFATPQPHLVVEEDEWIMVGSPEYAVPAPWYRVVTYGGQPNPSQKRVWATLSGPDWRHDSNGDGVVDHINAFLFNGVVAVHAATIAGEDTY